MVMAELLRTEEVAEADRFAQWRHWISSTVVPMERAGRGPGPAAVCGPTPPGDGAGEPAIGPAVGGDPRD